MRTAVAAAVSLGALAGCAGVPSAPAGVIVVDALVFSGCSAQIAALPLDATAAQSYLPPGFSLGNSQGLPDLLLLHARECAAVTAADVPAAGAVFAFASVAVQPPREHVRPDANAHFVVLGMWAPEGELLRAARGWGLASLAPTEVAIDLPVVTPAAREGLARAGGATPWTLTTRVHDGWEALLDAAAAPASDERRFLVTRDAAGARLVAIVDEIPREAQAGPSARQMRGAASLDARGMLPCAPCDGLGHHAWNDDAAPQFEWRHAPIEAPNAQEPGPPSAAHDHAGS